MSNYNWGLFITVVWRFSLDGTWGEFSLVPNLSSKRPALSPAPSRTWLEQFQPSKELIKRYSAQGLFIGNMPVGVSTLLLEKLRAHAKSTLCSSSAQVRPLQLPTPARCSRRAPEPQKQESRCKQKDELWAHSSPRPGQNPTQPCCK